MAILRPSYSSIYASLYTDVSTGLGAVPIARFSILGTLARALARAMDSFYGYADASFKNSVPWTATSTSQDAWAAMWGVLRENSLPASGTATVTFNAPTTIPSGTVFVGSNTVSYESVGDVVAVIAGTQVINLASQSNGANTNLAAGSVVTMTTAIPNVVATGTVINIVGGADAESDQSLFARAQQVRSEPPQGGAQGDMIEWSEAAGATRAWTSPSPVTPGNVVVYVMFDNNSNGGFPLGIGGTATIETRPGTVATLDLLTVANYIYGPYRRPVTAFVSVLAPAAQGIPITLSNTTPPITTAAGFTGSISGTTLTVTAMNGGVGNTGVIAVGDTLTGTGVLLNSTIVARGTGTGGTGTYTVSQLHRTVTSTAMTSTPTTVEFVNLLTALQARLLVIGSPLGMTVFESDLTQAIQTAMTSFNVVLPATATVISTSFLPTIGAVIVS